MATTYNGNSSVDHSKLAAINETMILMGRLELLGWTHTVLSQQLGVTTEMLKNWRVGGGKPPTEEQLAKLRRLRHMHVVNAPIGLPFSAPSAPSAPKGNSKALTAMAEQALEKSAGVGVATLARAAVDELMATPRRDIKRAPVFDHSPKSTEEESKQNAERAASLVRQFGTATTVRVAEKKAKSSKSVGDDRRVIAVIAKENPKRPGSKSHGRFALYHTGMTVEQFLAAGGQMADILHDTSHGFISLR